MMTTGTQDVTITVKTLYNKSRSILGLVVVVGRLAVTLWEDVAVSGAVGCLGTDH